MELDTSVTSTKFYLIVSLDRISEYLLFDLDLSFNLVQESRPYE